VRQIIKKSMAFFICLILIILAASCNNNRNVDNGDKDNGKDSDNKGTVEIPDYLNMDSQLPIVKPGTVDVTLKIMVRCGPYYQDMKSLDEIYFVKKYEERTNVKVEWQRVDNNAFDDALTASLAAGELPDVIMKGNVSNSIQRQYGEQGFFVNLMENDMLKTFAQNYYALTQKYPDILPSSLMPDGSLYSLGLVRNSVGSVINSKLYFNKEWLAAVGKSVPKTANELYEVLKAFKNNDPNKNGKQDEIGLYTSSSHLQMATLGMFGLSNRGSTNTHIDMNPSTGKARYFPITDDYRKWVEYVSRLYREGLLNKEYYEFTESKLGVYVGSNVCGAFAYTNLSALDSKNQEKITYLESPLTGPDGKNDWAGTTSVGNTGSYIITTACKYPEVALRWADYLYSDEGALFYYYGDVGVTAVKKDDGTYEFSDSVLKDFYAGKNSYDGCAVYVSLYAYGNSPTKTQVPFNSADDNRGVSLKSAYALINGRTIAWPAFTFTKQEERAISDIKKDIDQYVNTTRDAWIMGTMQLNDATWNKFVNRIKQMGVDKVVDAYNAALQRAYEQGFKEGTYTSDSFK